MDRMRLEWFTFSVRRIIIYRMHRILAAVIVLVCCARPTSAVVGGAQVIADTKSRPEVMFVGSRGNFCSGVAIAPDLVLTAAHCVLPGATYKLAELDANRQPVFKDTLAVAHHPQFSLKTMLAHRATADVALIRLKQPGCGETRAARAAASQNRGRRTFHRHRLRRLGARGR